MLPGPGICLHISGYHPAAWVGITRRSYISGLVARGAHNFPVLSDNVIMSWRTVSSTNWSNWVRTRNIDKYTGSRTRAWWTVTSTYTRYCLVCELRARILWYPHWMWELEASLSAIVSKWFTLECLESHRATQNRSGNYTYIFLAF